MTSAGDPAPVSDLTRVHVAVVECLDALERVILAAYSSKTNLTGDVGVDAAKDRLERLRVALENFPDGRLPYDPFISPDSTHPYLLEVEGHVSINGSSLHDASIRFIHSIYEGFKVKRTFIDPVTGEQFDGVDYTHSRKVMTDDGEIWFSGPMIVPHYTLQTWSADVWDKLRPVLCSYARSLIWKVFLSVCGRISIQSTPLLVTGTLP